ncbi:fructose-bisphosphate aldolase class I [Candidatus Kaiserbacteria bacterium]|nr:fructose-bisphosphate aldolase class I [Candidatus Kaiserbacteria bacterium]
MIDITKLNEVARRMVAPGKGVLAADESFGNISKKFEKLGIPVTEENRRAYREMLFTAPAIGNYISGIILFDETIRQSAKDGRMFVHVLNDAGVITGIKVDEGVEKIGHTEETTTKGLSGLAARLPEYVNMGAKFAKWRAVITIGEGMPTDTAIHENAKQLAAYAKMCQEAGLVPIVEPEVLMDWSNTIDVCRDATERTLVAVFEELKNAGVAIEGIILKPNMIIPGKESGTKAAPQEVAQMTVELFKKVLPANLPGVVFLSGGQSEVESTENLNAINRMGPEPWALSFSYGRALQSSALKIWSGKIENVAEAQKAFVHRAKMNSLATLGRYEGET